MYAVVGCSECSALWVTEGRPETTQCPRCGTRRKHAKRRKFVETDDETHAREIRASMLANRQGEGDAFAELDSYAEMERQVDDAGVDEETYLDESGVDTEAVSAAADRAEQGATGGASRKETVLSALRNLDQPTEGDIVAYAEERGVPASYTRKALEKLVRAGKASENRGQYRLL
jgi:DNA-directed RNA polymerase subunit RPC12/RpoP